MAGPNDYDKIQAAVGPWVAQNAHAHEIDIVLCMMFGAGLESNWSNISQTGGGGGRGYWQITNGPTDLAAQIKVMGPQYIQGVNNYFSAHQNQWSESDYLTIVQNVERPQKPYVQTQGQSTVDQKWQVTLTGEGTAFVNSTTNIANQITNAASNPINIAAGFLGPVLSFLSDLTDIRLWRSLGWIFLGVALLVIGVVLWVRGSLGSIAKEVI